MHTRGTHSETPGDGRSATPFEAASDVNFYAELRALAHAVMGGAVAGSTLQPTALLHEALDKLQRSGTVNAVNVLSFKTLVAKTLRQELIDHARAKSTLKRGGASQRQALTDDLYAQELPEVSMTELAEMLERIRCWDASVAKVLELRSFGGMTHDEIAQFLEMSVTSVERSMRMGRAWIERELHDDNHGRPPHIPRV